MVTGHRPTKSYNIELFIKGKDYSIDLVKVNMITSIISPYPVIFLTLAIDPSEIILDKLFGQDPIILRFNLLDTTTDENIPLENSELELMFLKSMNQIETKSQAEDQLNDEYQGSSTMTTLVTVVKKPFQTMTTLVNEVYHRKTIREIVSNLTSNLNSGLVFDSNNENTEVLEQVCIPPTIFYKSIKYLDNNFGLYDGVPIIYCDYENIVHIKNISNKLKQSVAFNVTQLSIDNNKKNEEIIEKQTQGIINHYYTTETIINTYNANARFAVEAKNVYNISKPNDRLFYIVSKDLETICQKYGLIFGKDKEIYKILDVQNRRRYIQDHSGYETTETFLNSHLSKSISNMSTLQITLSKIIKIEPLLQVGEAVNFESNILDFVSLTGKYILLSSKLLFIRQNQEWQFMPIINLIRTNKIR